MKNRLEINKTVITVISMNIIQAAAVLLILAYGYITGSELDFTGESISIGILLVLITLTALINSFIAIRSRYDLKHADIQYSLLKDSLSQVENLNNTLRAQRHDFMNNLQVVHSLMEMEEYSDAMDYIGKVYTDIQKVSRVLKTANPAINALLQAKTLSCEKRGITLKLDVSSRMENLPIPSWELCRVLGNLIDNSISALVEHSKPDTLKQIEVELFENLKVYGLRVKNNGPAIPSNLYSRIFETGFTTNASKGGEGMGLAIVKELLTNYNGSISVTSSENATVFDGQIPKAVLVIQN